jgi:Ca2+-binding EF-hand superfamily protein
LDSALKKQFAEFDRNKDGKISVKEWMAVMRGDGLPHLSESELQAFISQFDADRKSF